MPLTSVPAARHFEAVIQLVSEVRFAQAAEAAESVQWKPPEAAIGGKGPDWNRSRRMENFLTDECSPHRSIEPMDIEFVMSLLVKSGRAAAVVSTGPAGTQRLPCQRVGSGVGAEYAPTPIAAYSQSWHSHELRGSTIARLTGAAQQHATSPAKAPVRAARPNPSLKRSANGRPPAPGRWYAVHFHRPGAGVLPLSPA